MPKPTQADEQSPIAGARATLRVPAVLSELASEGTGLTLAELTIRLGVPKASLFRMLESLRQAGYVAREGSMFRLSDASFALARMIGGVAPPPVFPGCAQPVLDWLAGETGETVMLGVPTEQGDEIAYVAIVESTRPIRFALGIGDRRPLYSAAAGQAILAWLPPAQQRDYLRQTDFIAFTPDTCDAAALARRLQDIRRSGVAVDSGGHVEGATGVASAVLDSAGAVCAAIAVAGPSDRIAADQARIEPLVRRAAERISRIRGYRKAFTPNP